MFSVTLCGNVEGELRTVNIVDDMTASDFIGKVLFAFGGLQKADEIFKLVTPETKKYFLTISCSGEAVEDECPRSVVIYAYPGSPGYFAISRTKTSRW